MAYLCSLFPLEICSVRIPLGGGQACPCRICTILDDNNPLAPTRIGLQSKKPPRKKQSSASSTAVQGAQQGCPILLKSILLQRFWFADAERRVSVFRGDYGMFCESCNQSGLTLEGRCSRFSSQVGLVGATSTVPIQPNVIVGGTATPGDSITPSVESLIFGRQSSKTGADRV